MLADGPWLRCVQPAPSPIAQVFGHYTCRLGQALYPANDGSLNKQRRTTGLRLIGIPVALVGSERDLELAHF